MAKVKHIEGLQAELDAKIDDSQLSTDGTLAGNSDTEIPSEKAVKTYVDGKFSALPASMKYRGGINAVANPDISGASTGNAYIDGATNLLSGDTLRVVGNGTITDGTNSINVNKL